MIYLLANPYAEHPLLYMYVLGFCISIAFIILTQVKNPTTVDDIQRMSGASRKFVLVITLIAYGLLWPITWMVIAALLWKGKK